MVLEKQGKAEGRKLEGRAGGDFWGKWGNWGLGDRTEHAAICVCVCVSLSLSLSVSASVSVLI